MRSDSTLLHTGWPIWVMLAISTLTAALIARRYLQLPASRILFAALRALIHLLLVALVIPRSPGPAG